MKQSLLIILSVIVLSSCETYFVPDIGDQEMHYVFEGIITDEAKAHRVTIQESQAYDVDYVFNMGEGFNVSIESSDGDVFELTEANPGYYFTDTIAKGEIGKSYRLVAVAPNGKTYRSAYESLMESAEVKDLDGVLDEVDLLHYNEYTGFVEETYKGIRARVGVEAASFTPYYRYEYELITLGGQVYPGPTGPVYIFVSYPKSPKKADVLSLLNGNNYSDDIITKGPITFIPEYFMGDYVSISYEYDEEGNRLFDDDDITYSRMGFLIEVQQYSLNEFGYNYWKAIVDQTTSTGQIFDPVQAQIYGNITCNDEPDKLVFGYFGASSVKRRSKYMRLKFNGEVEVEEIKAFPDLDSVYWGPLPINY